MMRCIICTHIVSQSSYFIVWLVRSKNLDELGTSLCHDDCLNIPGVLAKIETSRAKNNQILNNVSQRVEALKLMTLTIHILCRWGTEGCHMFSRALHNYQFCTYKYRDVDSTRSAGHMAHPVYGAVAIQPRYSKEFLTMIQNYRIIALERTSEHRLQPSKPSLSSAYSTPS